MKTRAINYRDIQLIVAVVSMTLAIGTFYVPFSLGVPNWIVGAAIMVASIHIEIRLEGAAKKAEKARLKQLVNSPQH